MRTDRPMDEGWADAPTRLFGQTGQWEPPLDVLEQADAVEIRIDVPGVAAEDLSITATGSTLTVDGRKAPLCSQARAFHVAERLTGAFTRVLPLRISFDARAIRATLDRGELRIVVPRMTERRGRPIPIPIETA